MSRLVVASVIARAHWSKTLKPGEPYDKTDFKFEAKLLGADVAVAKKLYRLDARTPEEIRKNRGFWPSPKKDSQTFWEHSIPDNKGSGHFVSTSTKPIENKVIEVVLSSILNYSGVAFFAHGNPKDENGKYLLAEETTRLYEYRMENVEGVKIPKNYGIESENEFTTLGIEYSQIAAVRTVDVQLKNGQIVGFKKSVWLDLQTTNR